MKTINNRISLLFLALTLLMGVSACRKETPKESAAETLRVLASDHSFTAEGGTGTATLSEEGFSAKSDAEWLRIGATSGNKLTYTVAPNPEGDTRTANLLLTCGEQKQRISITQLGAYAYIADLKASYEVSRAGGDVELPIKGAISILEPKVDNLPSWLTFKKEAGKLIFTAAPMTEVYREATVTITLGTVYKQAVKFVQSYGPLGYDFLVGKYRMQGIRFYKDANVDMEVELAKSPDGKKLILKGLSADLPLEYDAATNSLKLTYGLLASTGAGIPQGQFLCVAAWGANFPGSDGKANLSLYASGTCLGSWDKASVEHPKFTFRSEGNLASIRGICIYLAAKQDGTSFTGYYLEGSKIFSVADFSLTKK